MSLNLQKNNSEGKDSKKSTGNNSNSGSGFYALDDAEVLNDILQ